jgi:hypothetical protein
MKLKQWENDAILYIMERFDFKRVHKIMIFLDWKWGTLTGTMEVPSEQTIRECALDLLKKSCEDNGGGWATVGLYVTLDVKKKTLNLEFVVERKRYSKEYDG